MEKNEYEDPLAKIEQRYNICKSFYGTDFIQESLDYFQLDLNSNDVIFSIYENSYKLMGKIKEDVGTECDPFHDEFPILIFGGASNVKRDDTLLLLKKKYASEMNDEKILFMPNRKFEEKLLQNDDKNLLKDADSFRRQMFLNRSTVFSAYSKDTNAIWIDISNLLHKAVTAFLGFTYRSEIYHLNIFGHWKDYFEGLIHEFGHFLFKEDFEQISATDFVEHPNSKAHISGKNYSKRIINDQKFIDIFFDILMPK